MRTFASRTNSLVCLLAVGLLSACTVTVTEETADSTEGDAGGETSEEQESSTGSESENGGGTDGGEITSTESTDTSDGQDLTVNLGHDAGHTSAADGGTGESDGGAVASRFACGDRSPEGATNIAGDIVEDVTWEGTIYVTAPIDVYQGATVTIKPGTHIIMAADADIEFGWNSGAVTVDAQGTPSEPITICGEDSDAGFWGSVVFGGSVTSNSTFKNVLVSDGGSDVAAVRFASDVHVENLQVANSAEAGVEAYDFADDSSELSVFDAGGAAVILMNQNAMNNFPVGGVFEGNNDNHVVVSFDSLLGNDTVTVHNVGIPYLQARQLEVYESAVLEFEPGVLYRFSSDANLLVGWNSSDPTIFVNGTTEAPVIFEGQTAEAGYWHGLTIGGNVRSNSKISNLILRHGGGDSEPALDIFAPITLDGVTLEMNETGALIGAQGLDPDSANLTISGTEGVPLTVAEPDALVTLPQGGTYTGNDDDVIAIDGDTYTAKGTVFNLGVPYRVLRSIDTMDASEMTIEAGNIFEMSADTSIEFGWNSAAATLVAVGTADAPITFKGLDPVGGAWVGLYINSNVTSDSSVEYVTIEHAGDATDPESGAAIHLNAQASVSNCEFNDIAGYGVIVGGEGDPATVTDNTVSGTTIDVLKP